MCFRQELKLDHVDEIIHSIKHHYETFNFYQENRETIETHTLIDFVETAISHRDRSIRSDLQELHDLVAPHHSASGTGSLLSLGIINLMAQGIKVNKYVLMITK